MLFTETLQTLNTILSTDLLINSRYDIVTNFNLLNTYAEADKAGIVQMAYDADLQGGYGNGVITPEALRTNALEYVIQDNVDLVATSGAALGWNSPSSATSAWLTNVQYWYDSIQDYHTNTAIPAFGGDSGELSGRVSNLESDVLFLSGEIDNNSADITYLSGEIDSLSSGPLSYNNLLHVSDQQADNTGGGPITAGVWTARPLRVAHVNNISGASLAVDPTNQITLPAGTYWIEAMAQGYWIDHNVIRIREVSPGASDLVMGLRSFTSSGHVTPTNWTHLRGAVVLGSSSIIELQHLCTRTNLAVNGMGYNSTLGGANSNYCDIKIWKVA